MSRLNRIFTLYLVYLFFYSCFCAVFATKGYPFKNIFDSLPIYIITIIYCNATKLKLLIFKASYFLKVPLIYDEKIDYQTKCLHKNVEFCYYAQSVNNSF